MKANTAPRYSVQLLIQLNFSPVNDGAHSTTVLGAQDGRPFLTERTKYLHDTYNTHNQYIII